MDSVAPRPLASVGRYEGTRADAPERAVNIDAQVDTFMGGRGKFVLVVDVEPKDSSEGAGTGGDSHSMSIPLTPDDYRALFGGRGPVELPPLESSVSQYTAHAFDRGRQRVVVFEEKNLPDEDIGLGLGESRRGRLELVAEDGKIRSAHLEKSRRRAFLGLPTTWHDFLDVNTGALSKTRDGLGLVDEGEHGRVAGLDAIRSAVDARGTGSLGQTLHR
ncbi:MAG: hypothetical protein IPK13_03240 [Deltaproteobacteria bacterium]|nr:hypothetical protein [Deltaproteobacteria bacterium]